MNQPIPEEMMTKEELVARLRDPATKGHRGSIVWALQEHDCKDILDDLVTCVIEGSFEEVQHAVDIMQTEGLRGIDTSSLIARLCKAIGEGRVGDWRREAVDECLLSFAP